MLKDRKLSKLVKIELILEKQGRFSILGSRRKEPKQKNLK